MFDDSHTILVTGGAGFIGSAVVRHIIRETGARLINVDKLTYAANLDAVAEVADSPRYAFVQADITDAPAMADLFGRFRPSAVLHLAAESHVDRSIDGPAEFIRTNVLGTGVLLEAARAHWTGLEGEARARFRFLHVSTDEVFGSLGPTGSFTEDSPYQPNSPYAASKAGSDHLARAWHHTYGLPVLITNCSNNYGPFQFPEKLIPLMIGKALAGEPLPVYGTGENVRDWLHVEDHARALLTVLAQGRIGETYAIGGDGEISNLALVQRLCDRIDALRPDPAGPRRRLIRFVSDRPGHDFRYAMSFEKLNRELGWRPRETLDSGLDKTVRWYLENWPLMERLRNRVYDGGRLGLAPATGKMAGAA